MKYIPEAFVLAVLITLSFLIVWDKAFGETIDTGNILSNYIYWWYYWLDKSRNNTAASYILW